MTDTNLSLAINALRGVEKNLVEMLEPADQWRVKITDDAAQKCLRALKTLRETMKTLGAQGLEGLESGGPGELGVAGHRDTIAKGVDGNRAHDSKEAGHADDSYYILVYVSGETCPIHVARVKEHLVNEHGDLILVYDLDDNSNTQNRWYSYDWDYYLEASVEEFVDALGSMKECEAGSEGGREGESENHHLDTVELAEEEGHQPYLFPDLEKPTLPHPEKPALPHPKEPMVARELIQRQEGPLGRRAGKKDDQTPSKTLAERRGESPSDKALSREFWERWSSTDIHIEAAIEMQRIYNRALAKSKEEGHGDAN